MYDDRSVAAEMLVEKDPGTRATLARVLQYLETPQVSSHHKPDRLLPRGVRCNPLRNGWLDCALC